MKNEESQIFNLLSYIFYQMKTLIYKKNYSDKFVKPMLKAIKAYNMVENGQKVAVALSGGKDSITLLYLFAWLQKYSHLDFELSAIHINTFESKEEPILQDLCDSLQIKLHKQNLLKPDDLPPKSICSACARLKRGAMRQICDKENISSLAFGHHATDIAETLFMNMFINKKLGSFCPIVEIPDSKVKIIRPMVYLTEKRIIDLHKEFQLPVVKYKCPYETQNQRAKYKTAMQLFSKSLSISDYELNIVSSLENLDYSNLYQRLLQK